MTYDDIIKSVNTKVENSSFERFSVTQVLDELNNTYRDLANKTDIFETFDYLKLQPNQLNYQLPATIYRPTRAVYRGKKIEFKSQEEMDLNIPTWEADSTASELEYLVYNNMGDKRMKVYPRLTDLTISISQSEILYLGKLREVYDLLNIYLYMNTSTGAKYVAPTLNATPADLIEVVTIYGAYLPPIITEADLSSDRIFIDETKVNALIYGTAGNLLFNLGRTEDMQKGQNFLRIYGLDETEIGAIRSKSFDGGFNNTTRNTFYRTPFRR